MAGSQERYKKTFPISWEQLHRDSKALAWRLLDMENWEGIVTITRGGLVPASVIARELEIRVMATIPSQVHMSARRQARALESRCSCSQEMGKVFLYRS